MVATAGVGTLCKAIEMSLADWSRQSAVNLTCGSIGEP
jgi:hypothetical protein